MDWTQEFHDTINNIFHFPSHSHNRWISLSSLTSCCLSHSTQNPVSQHSLREQNSRRARPEIMPSFRGGFLGLVCFRFLFYIPENLRVQILACQEALWHRCRLQHITPAQVWFEYLRGWGTSLEACATGFLIDWLPPCYWWKVAGKKKTPLFDEAIYVERLLLSFPFSLNFCQFVCLYIANCLWEWGVVPLLKGQKHLVNRVILLWTSC